ncbi:MAG: response regulator [Anaerolineae bacterium]|nr:response regulator [Anaerolineae bacterium]
MMCNTQLEVPQRSAGTPLILIVEDNPDTQTILRTQLTHYHFDVVCKSDGQSALIWLGDHQADLILLDLMLPDMDGFEVARRVRQQYPAAVLPILMLSALGVAANERVRGLEAGANDIMAKPYEITELIARIRVLLNVTKETEDIQSSLSRYMTDALRTQAKLDPELLTRRQRRHAVVMFADLRGFTHMASHTPPENMLHVLDKFFSAMMKVADRHGGVIFDLIGDELLVAFNVPYDVPAPSFLAVQAALKMQELFNDLRYEWLQLGIKVGLGIGIHQGEVVLGNVGAAELMRYTVMGNVVNIAHRLVELASDREIIISADVYTALPDSANGFRSTAIPQVKLKGLSEPQCVYQITIPTPS